HVEDSGPRRIEGTKAPLRAGGRFAKSFGAANLKWSFGRDTKKPFHERLHPAVNGLKVVDHLLWLAERPGLLSCAHVLEECLHVTLKSDSLAHSVHLTKQ